MASTAPTVLFCERGNNMRSDVATGSFVGPCGEVATAGAFAVGAGDGACAKPVARHIATHAISKIVFKVSLLGLPAYTGNDRQVILRSREHPTHRGHRERSGKQAKLFELLCVPCVLCG